MVSLITGKHQSGQQIARETQLPETSLLDSLLSCWKKRYPGAPGPDPGLCVIACHIIRSEDSSFHLQAEYISADPDYPGNYIFFECPTPTMGAITFNSVGDATSFLDQEVDSLVNRYPQMQIIRMVPTSPAEGFIRSEVFSNNLWVTREEGLRHRFACSQCGQPLIDQACPTCSKT